MTIFEIKNFLNKRGLKEPNGLPLYTYQVIDIEFDELKEHLKYLLRYNDKSNALPGLFCLYCSEWYRRYYRGEWSWSAILKSLDTHLDYNFISDFVIKGFKYWRRPITRYNNSRNSYLGSVFREGGLPYSLLIEESRFQALFRNIIKLYSQNPQLILDHNTLLPHLTYFPEALKDDTTLSLIAEMATRIISLVEMHDLSHQINPIQYLDHNVSDWRLQFPIPLSGEIANQFMLGLLNSAVKESRLKLNKIEKCILKQYWSNDTFILSLDIPRIFGFIPHKELNQQRLSVYLYEGSYYLAEISSAYLHDDGSDSANAKIKLRNNHIDTVRKEKELPLVLVIKQQGVIVYQESIANSELPINEMPLVLSDDVKPRVIGFGSVKKKINSLHIMLNKSAKIETLDKHSEAIEVEENNKYQHYLLNGEAIVTQNDEKFIISSLNDHIRTDVKIIGQILPYFTSNGRPIYLDSPSLSQKDDEFILKIKRDKYSQPLYGDHYARILDKSGNLIFKQKLAILPYDFKIKLCNGNSPRNGIIEFSTSHTFSIEKLEAQVKSISDTTKQLYVTTSHSTLQSMLSVKIRCNLDSAVEIILPFPSSGVLLLDKDGYDVSNKNDISMKELLGHRLRFYPNLGVSTTYTIDIKNSLNNQKYWSYHIDNDPIEVSLYEFKQELISLLSATGILDEQIKLIISRDNREIKQIKIKLYSDDLFINNNLIEKPNKDIKLALLSLTDLTSKDLILDEEENYILPNQIYSPSLIIPKKESELQSRAVFIPATFSMEVEGDLQQAISLPPLQYQEGVKLVLDNMARDFNHPGWNYLEKLYAEFNYLPLPTFLIWKELIKHTEALVMFVIKHNQTEKVMQVFQDEYNVIWALIPRTIWNEKLEIFQQQFKEIPVDILNLAVQNKLTQISYFSPIMKAHKDSVNLSIMKFILPQWYQDLNRRHIDQYWITEFSEELAEWIRKNKVDLDLTLYSPLHQSIVYFPFFAAAVASGKATFDELREMTDKDFYIFKSLIEFDYDWFKPVYLFALSLFE